MCKGQAVVNFEATGSSDPDGHIVSYAWDFGDSQAASGPSVVHVYQRIDTYQVTLTVTDDCGESNQSSIAITVAEPTLPCKGNDGHPDKPATSTPPPMPADATLGFCHKVRCGETLSGIALHYGVSWEDLARINRVPMYYFVIAEQSLFIPSGEIKPGRHVYRAQPGDSLSSLAYQCGLSVTGLAGANNLAVDQPLTPGQVVVIPLWH